MNKIVGICGFQKDNFFGTPQKYIDCIMKAGGIPVLISNSSENIIKQYLDTIDNLMFIGGGDIDASFFGKKALPTDSVPDYKRDIFEIEICKLAYEKKIPMLGICRGCQVINVALGGTLLQDIPFHTGEKYSSHVIAIDKNSILYKIFNREQIEVNSFHHQVCEKIPDCLSVTAQSIDGYIEAFECSKQYIHGVQFHPERLSNDDCFLNIFTDFLRG